MTYQEQAVEELRDVTGEQIEELTDRLADLRIAAVDYGRALSRPDLNEGDAKAALDKSEGELIQWIITELMGQ